MPFKTPKTATAAALAVGLVGPFPLLAQEAVEADLPECMEMVTLPCVTATGALVEGEAELGIYLDAFPEEAAAAAERAAAETATELDAEAESEAAEPAEVTDETAPEEAGAEASEGQADPPEATPPDAVAEQDAPLPEADPAPEASETEAPAADAPAPEAADAPEAAEAPEAPVTEPPAADAVEAPATEAPAADPVEAEASEPSPVAPEPRPEGLDTSEAPAQDPVAAPMSEAQGMAVTDDTAPPAAAAAAADEAVEGAEVEETVVTEETARSSAEDFATAIIQQIAPAQTGETASTRRNDTLQRALAAGLGGLALGALLDQGNQVAVQSDDRLVLRQDDGALRLFRDENALLRQPGARVRTETFDDGSTRTTVRRDDGTEIVTIRGADGAILRRIRVLPDGREVLLIDDMVAAQPIEVSRLPEPRRETLRYTGDEEALRQALARAMGPEIGRSFTLRQIREIDRVRYLAPEIEIDAVTFATASAAITPDQARQLSALGRTMVALIEENPAEVFLVEGHTDAVGDASYNLALSDRRAESVALALIEYFDVPPENLVVQGYGEFDLRIDTQAAERQNRRAVVRRITGLLGTEEAALR